MASLIGQQRGNYQLTKLLGQGGFAEVYLGEHIHLGSQVAVKVLYTRLDEKGVQQFKQEAITLQKLSHPHIVKIIDFGFDNNDIPYLIMDYATNGTLADRHPLGTPIATSTVVEYIKQVASALQYAHDNKIIHRDIKPENMLVDQNNNLLLSDFGIARVVQTYSVGTGHITGSFQYMAPEQAAGRAVFASDQYALGIVAYQWLCGNLPFQGNNMELMVQHRMEAPPAFPTTLQIPTDVETVAMKALAKEPQQRFATVQEFATSLEQGYQALSRRRSKKSPTTNSTNLDQSVIKQETVSLDTLYDQGVTAKNQGQLEQAQKYWKRVLALDPNYLNGLLAKRVEEMEQELLPIRIQKLRQQAQTLDYETQWDGNWQQILDSANKLLQSQPQNQQIQAICNQAQQMLQRQQEMKTYRPLYNSAKRYVEEAEKATTIDVQVNKVANAKMELDYLQKQAPPFGDPARLQQKINNLEWRINAPAREVENIRKKTDFVLNFLAICMAFLSSGVGATLGLLSQSTPIAIASTIIMLLIFTGIFVYEGRKPHDLTVLGIVRNFALAISFAIILTIGITLLTSQLHYYQRFPSGYILFIGEQFIYLGRQITFGLILSSLIAIGIFVVDHFLEDGLEDYLYYSDSDYLKRFLLIFAIVIVAGNAVLYALSGAIAAYFRWGFGFGYGWYWTLLAMVVALVLVTGATLCIHLFTTVRRR